MIVIDIPADLNMARVPEGREFNPGDIAVAGRSSGWSWVEVDEVSDDLVYFHQISAREASSHGSLVASA